jgi:hypothetical protein
MQEMSLSPTSTVTFLDKAFSSSYLETTLTVRSKIWMAKICVAALFELIWMIRVLTPTTTNGMAGANTGMITEETATETTVTENETVTTGTAVTAPDPPSARNMMIVVQDLHLKKTMIVRLQGTTITDVGVMIMAEYLTIMTVVGRNLTEGGTTGEGTTGTIATMTGLDRRMETVVTVEVFLGCRRLGWTPLNEWPAASFNGFELLSLFLLLFLCLRRPCRFSVAKFCFASCTCRIFRTEFPSSIPLDLGTSSGKAHSRNRSMAMP